MASKSLSDLESLVDQIPSIAESGGQRLAQQQHMSEESLAEKLEQHQSYLSSYGPGGPGNPNYSPPLSSSQYADSYNNPIYSMSSRSQQESQQNSHSKSYTVENLASSNYTPSHGQHYANILQPGPHYPVPMSAAAAVANNGYLFGGLDASLMQQQQQQQQRYGMASHQQHHPSLHGHHPMNQSPYAYQTSSYQSSFDAYSSAASPSNPSYGQGYTSGGQPSPGGSSTPPAAYHHMSAGSRPPPVDLAYDGV